MLLEEINSYEAMKEKLIYLYLPTRKQCYTLCHIFESFADVPVRKVLDIGCGHGRHSLELSRRGYDVLGIDVSEEAIEICNGKKEVESNPRLLVCDMRKMAFRERFDAAFSHNSTIGYVLDEHEVAQIFSIIHGFVNNGGVFVFDYFYPMNLVRNGLYKPELTLHLDVDGLHLTKESRHEIDLEKQIHYERSTYTLTDGESSVVFQAKEVLRYYEPDQIRELLGRSRFGVIYIYDRERYCQIGDQTNGFLVIAKK
ncbi:MAG: class I SAM-dependent methyltransferase [Nanoarchaeota archaeon]|nr:class I SAM-dependent methyltransferase [Nanoarchaeota archaeon]